MLQNEYLVAKIGVDRAENGPSKVEVLDELAQGPLGHVGELDGEIDAPRPDQRRILALLSETPWCTVCELWTAWFETVSTLKNDTVSTLKNAEQLTYSRYRRRRYSQERAQSKCTV